MEQHFVQTKQMMKKQQKETNKLQKDNNLCWFSHEEILSTCLFKWFDIDFLIVSVWLSSQNSSVLPDWSLKDKKVCLKYPFESLNDLVAFVKIWFSRKLRKFNWYLWWSIFCFLVADGQDSKDDNPTIWHWQINMYYKNVC